jgi:hypothetical protein
MTKRKTATKPPTRAASNSATIARTQPGNGNLRPWKPGQSGNPKGRPKGSRDKINEAFIREMVAAWEIHGRAAIEKVAKADPTNFVKIAASLLPKDVNVKGEHDHKHNHEHRSVSETAQWLADVLGQTGKDRATGDQVNSITLNGASHSAPRRFNPGIGELEELSA